MMQLMLFGLMLNPIYNAIAVVESGRGMTSANVYQIRDIYLKDLERLYGRSYPSSIKTNKSASEDAMYDYWRYYAYKWSRDNGGKPITYEVLSRVHAGGPNGMNKKSTIEYWHRVRKQLMFELSLGNHKISSISIDTNKIAEAH